MSAVSMVDPLVDLTRNQSARRALRILAKHSAVLRLVNMNLKPFLIASALRIVVAQRVPTRKSISSNSGTPRR